jgi:uncharacterized protein (DUF1330 family)
VSCYFVAQISIHDPMAYELYLDAFDEVFEGFKGEVLAVDDAPLRLEGEWPGTRTVLMRFPSQAEALRWYNSEGYQALVKLRQASAHANIALVEGQE